MNIHIQKSELIKNNTLQHLESWIVAVQEYISEEKVLQTIPELAVQLEVWRLEFVINNSKPSVHQSEGVTITLYGKDVILIADSKSGEFLKITESKHNEPREIRRPQKTTFLFRTFAVLAFLVAFTFPGLSQAAIKVPTEVIEGWGVRRTGKDVVRKQGRETKKNIRQTMRGRNVHASLKRKGGEK